MKYSIKHKKNSKKNSKKHSKKNSKKNSKKRKNRKITKKYYKGGELTVKPFEMLSYPYGASSASQAAFLTGRARDQEQKSLNQIGGEVQANKTMEVPQFYPIGGIKTAYTTTGLSVDGNLTNVIGEVDSTNDHFAKEQSGAGKRRKYYRRSRRNKRY